MRSLFAELKRRNVYRFAVFYCASAWLLVQVATQVFPFFHIAEWVVRWIVVAAIVGLPFAIAFAWFYEFTPEGLKRESEIDPSASITRRTGRALDRWIIAVLGVAVVLLIANTFVRHKDARQDAGSSVSDKSIAVLPLTNESGDSKEDYFSDGLSEDLITALSQFAGLKVISRNSSFQFRDSKDGSKAIGEKLGVAHLLEGSVRRAGEEVRISATLVKAADGSTAWSERYDRPYKDLFRLQDDITQAVAASLKTQLFTDGGAVVQSDRPPSGNLEAYEAYLRGRQLADHQTEADTQKAIESFGAAIELDPRYAQAYAAQSRAWTLLSGAFLEGERARKAIVNSRAAVNTALSLDPDLAEAHRARGRLLTWADFDWTGAEAEYRRAFELAPSDPLSKGSLAEMELTLGRPQRALDLIQQALVVDALNADRHLWLGIVLPALGRLDEAEQATRRALALQPSIPYGYSQLSQIQLLKGETHLALETALATPESLWRAIAIALARQVGDDRAAADAALGDLIAKQADSAAYQIAQTYALRKEPDRVFEWLDRAWAQRDPGINSLLYDSLVAPYRTDARFAAFCRKVGLPAATSESSSASGSATRTP